MAKGLLGRVFGDANSRAVKRLQPIVRAVNALEPRFTALSDEDLRGVTADLRVRHQDGASLDDLLPEAFAAVREAARRTIGLRHFDVQLIGGGVLHQGTIAEMRTGEGKTLVATLPSYLHALTGQGVHIVTVNDYLARRDTQWMGPVYAALGATVGCLQHEASYIFDPAAPEGERLRPVHRREAYAADITYGTNSEFGFDYLRDNMALDLSQRVQRELAYAIVDEVDYILIDEARTPLIISGPAQEPSQSYTRFADLARRLRQTEDYTVDEKTRTATLTEEGITKVERALGVPNLYDPEHYALTHYMENALKGEVIFQRDKDYVVTKDNQVVLVDEFTGRLMPGRRYSDGLHQALEAKEGVTIQRETVTLATITLQNYFRLYAKLAGMTGTAATEADEFFKIYHLEVVTIPTDRLMIREDMPDLIYLIESAKFKAVADRIEELHQEGRPVLIGTVSIEKSEELSSLLRQRGVPHEVLNAKQHEREAAIIAQAGRIGAVTVATNMAGRGTDIILGGNPAGRDPGDWQQEHERVVALGGLFILGTERHEARRIDNQLRGRAGRQGDPGASLFFVSLEDEVIRRFGGDRVKSFMAWAGMDENTPIQNRMVERSFQSAQMRVEGYNFEIRKHLVEYDDVINRQREVIYGERTKVLAGADLQSNIQEMVRTDTEALANEFLSGRDPVDWNVDGFLAGLQGLMPVPDWATPEELRTMTRSEVLEEVLAHADSLLKEKEEALEPERMRHLERLVVLQMIDNLWVQHLTAMENMRLGVGLQAYGQRDPLVVYRQEGHAMFQELLERLRHDVARTLLYVTIRTQPAPVPAASVAGQRAESPMTSQQRDAQGLVASGTARTPVRRDPHKVGRNDPCWCGSGLKYKRCHGLAA